MATRHEAVLAQKPSQWDDVFRTEAATVAFERTTIRRGEAPDEWLVWVRWTFDPPRRLRSGTTVAYMKQLERVDCAGRRIRLVQATPFDPDGEPLDTRNVDTSTPWQYVAPDSRGDREWRAICRAAHRR